MMDGTDVHQTQVWAQQFKSSYDDIWEGENNQHFVTKTTPHCVSTHNKTIAALTLQMNNDNQVKTRLAASERVQT